LDVILRGCQEGNSDLLVCRDAILGPVNDRFRDAVQDSDGNCSFTAKGVPDADVVRVEFLLDTFPTAYLNPLVDTRRVENLNPTGVYGGR
jgi:hypothetical protein